MTITLEQREALELKYDGKIPAHLLNPLSDNEIAAGHHRGMIRYSESRVRDFRAEVAKLEAMPESPYRAHWLKHCRACLADHEAELARHQAALAAVTTTAQAA